MSATVTQVGAIARRSVVRTSRQPAMAIPPLVFPVALMLVNSAGLEPSTLLPGFPTDSFLAFALAVPFIQGALFSTMNAGTDIARDVQTGFVNRLSLTALRDWPLLIGQLTGIVVLGVVQVLFYIAVGLVAGVHFASGPAGIAVLVVYGAIVALSFGALGAWLAYRTGSGETIQALFPVLFVFLFISSMNAPRNLIGVDWFRIAATLNPVSYMIECVRSLIITGWDWQALALGFGFVILLGLASLLLAAGALRSRMTRSRRTLKNALTNPQILLPTMAFPLFFFTAFAGGLSQISKVPGFDFPPGYTAFQFVFVLLQSAAFGGVFTGFGVARDFENGFAKRLMIAAPHRSGIVLGYAFAALVRWLIVAVLLTVVGFAVGMNVGGGAVDLVGLYVLAALVNFCGFFWAGGIAMRFRTIQAGPLMQMPVFLILFFAPVYVPLELLEGWIHGVATVNPITYLLETGRGFVSGNPPHIAGAIGIAIVLGLLFWLWAFRGLRSAEAAGA